MAATLTSMNSALRRIYTPDSLVEQLFQENEFLSDLEGRTRYKIGEAARVVIHTRRNGGTTFAPDGGSTTLNTAGQQGITHAEYDYAHEHQQIRITENVLEQSSGDALAVAEVLDVEVSGALNDLRKQLTRTLFGNGDGIICGVRTQGGAASAEVELALLDGFNAIERGWLFGDSGDGLQVDIGTAASEASLVNGEKIVAVEEVAASPSITVTTAINTTATTHFVSLKDARSGATSYEPNGLRNISSASATLGGLTVAAAPVWKGNTDTTAQALTLSLLLQQDQKVKQKSGSAGDAILTGLKQERKLYELLQQQVRYSSDSSIDAGGVDRPTWHGMQIQSHPDCPNEDLYVYNKKHLFIVSSGKPFWQSKHTGGKTLDWIQGTDDYGAKLAYHFNLATDRRNVISRLGGLT